MDVFDLFDYQLLLVFDDAFKIYTSWVQILYHSDSIGAGLVSLSFLHGTRWRDLWEEYMPWYHGGQGRWSLAESMDNWSIYLWIPMDQWIPMDHFIFDVVLISIGTIVTPDPKQWSVGQFASIFRRQQSTVASPIESTNRSLNLMVTYHQPRKNSQEFLRKYMFSSIADAIGHCKGMTGLACATLSGQTPMMQACCSSGCVALHTSCEKYYR